jgi:hypothetical protein
VDVPQLDDLAREIGSQLPRRSVLGALSGLAALFAASAGYGEARKRKKKCKGGKKRCGKQCVPADQCCSSADCGRNGQCANGTCVCPAGKKACHGRCIAEGNCCTQDDCPGDQYCDEQTCRCPDGYEPCPGNICPSGDECCGTGDCASGQACDDGFCWCTSAGEIYCDDACCDASNGEICNWDANSSTCVGGGCQRFDWCNVDDDSVCRDDSNAYCVCITSYAPAATAACVHAYTLEASFCGDSACDDNSDCGDGYVCVAGTSGAKDFCGCGGKFCALLCDAVPQRDAEQRVARAHHAIRDVKRKRSR